MKRVDNTCISLSNTAVTVGGLLCYKCDVLTDPSHCSVHTQCGPDDVSALNAFPP